jgi:acyl carrier protein
VTLERQAAGLARDRVLADLTGMILTVTGEDPPFAARITPAAQLEGDLRFDSLELTALGGLIGAAYGHRADLPAFLATLDIDQLIGLTVGDLADHLCGLDCAANSGAAYSGAANSTAGSPG